MTVCLGRIAAAVLLPGLLAACSTTDKGNGPSLASARLPEYAVGDAFTFDDGRTERVMSSDSTSVHWSSSDDFAFATYPNVLLPRTEWDSSTEHGERRLDAAPNALWPLTVGNRAKIKAHQTVLLKATGRTSVTVQDWTCSVPDTAKISTKAGTFDTYRVICRLETESLFVAYEQERIFYYAPAIRYYIRREDRYRGGDFSAIQLVDFRTADAKIPAPLSRLRNATIQQALETKLSGEAVGWQSERNDFKGTVEPLRTFRGKSGQYCRDYAETIDDGTRLYRVAATACRSRDGKWRNPPT